MLCLYKLNIDQIINQVKISNQYIQENDVQKINLKVSKSNISKADEIMKFKKLLDCGAITQEEFDIEKKKLLNC